VAAPTTPEAIMRELKVCTRQRRCVSRGLSVRNRPFGLPTAARSGPGTSASWKRSSTTQSTSRAMTSRGAAGVPNESVPGK
jgi:hypothetical protein